MTEPKVLITGASRGIGAAIAKRLAADGFEVWLNYRTSEDQAKEVLETILAEGHQACLLPFDVADPKQVADILLPKIISDGPLYGLVNNAGITRDAPFMLIKQQDWSEVIATHLDGFYHVTRPVLRSMLRKKAGRIVNVSSVAGLTGNRGQVSYSAAKAALLGATRALAREVARQNVLVNAVAPGLIATEMTEEIPVEVKELVPLGRMGRPEEVASVVSFLMSGDASYITGEVICISGGLMMS